MSHLRKFTPPPPPPPLNGTFRRNVMVAVSPLRASLGKSGLALALLLVWGSGPAPVNAQQVHAGDKAALEAFYDGTGGASWTNNTNWKSSKPLGEWYGVTTNSAGRVTGLRMENNNLNGSLPTALGSLSELKSLSIYDSGLTGSIPTQLGNTSNILKVLAIYGNGLSGSIPSQLWRLDSLKSLTIYGNNLTGSIPVQVGNINNLEKLKLSGSKLTGSIPTRFGQLHNLEKLEIRGASLTGSIPSQLGNLSKLKSLTLYAPSTTGGVPAELKNLSNMEVLNLAHNDLTSIPSELSELSSLKKLLLYGNDISSVPTEVWGMSNLEWLSLGSNDLTSIPSGVNGLTSLKQLFLYDNELTSLPSQLGSLSGLERLSLQRNQITGQLPSGIANMADLRNLNFADNNGLCAPDTSAFRALEQRLGNGWTGYRCGHMTEPPPPPQPPDSGVTPIGPQVEGLTAASGADGTSLSVGWTAFDGAASHGIRWAEVTVTKGNGFEQKEIGPYTTRVATDSANGHSISGLTTNQLYNVEVAALDADGDILATGTVEGTPSSLAAPDPNLAPTPGNPVALISEFADIELADGISAALDMADHFSGAGLTYEVMVTTTHQGTGQ